MHGTVAVAAVVLLGTIVFTQEPGNRAAAALRNPVAPTAESISAGKRAYDANCVGCHGDKAQGAVKAGTAISIIQEQGGKQPPDLTDDAWDHGRSDGEVFTAIKKGLPPTMMAGWEGRDLGSPRSGASSTTFARSQRTRMRPSTAAPTVRAAPRTTLELADYLQLPITADPNGENTRAQLARVNFMREEPGGRRFFVNDLNGPLYILDKKTKQLTTYLDFNGLAGPARPVPAVHVRAQPRDRPHQRRLRPRLRAQRRLLHDPHGRPDD